ncbi:MAG: fibronectin type III domain-containing protein [Calditrichaeota bacterium]|nr:fibronectin type III domain-containing protein [Calditrichota bacterium]
MSFTVRHNLMISSKSRKFSTLPYYVTLSLFIVILVLCGCENDTVDSRNPFVIQNLSAVTINDHSVYLEWIIDPLSYGLEFLLQRSLNNGESWFDVVTLDEAPFTFTDTNLNEGTTYLYQVLTISGTDTSEPSNPAQAITFPKAPSDLNLFSISGSTIGISWSDSSDIETGYEVCRRQGLNGEYNYEVILPSNTTTFNDSGLLCNKRYYYRVRAFMDNLKSHWSEEIAAITNPIPVILIAEVRSDSIVWLGWSDNSQYETGFRLERFRAGIIDMETILSRNSTSYIDINTEEGEVYEYQVRVMFNDAISPPGETTIVVTPPLPPVNLRVVQDSNIDTVACLTWDDLSSVETGFEIQRKTQHESDYKMIVQLGENTTDFRNTGLEPYKRYYYRTRALMDTLTSGWSNEDNLFVTVLIPLRPTDLVAEALAPTQVKLEWTDNAIIEDGYIVECILPEDNHWTFIDTLAENSNLLYKGGLTSESSYTYRIYAYNDQGNSPYSNYASVITPKEIPTNPTNLHVVEVTYSSVSISWQDNSYNESGFRVERCLPPLQSWAQIGVTDTDDAAFIDTSVDYNETYRYRVAAYNEAGVSAWTRELIVSVPDGPPGAPLYLHAIPVSWNSIRLIWSRSTDNESGYCIERRSELEIDFSPIAETGYAEVFYNDTDLSSQILYFYRVRAFNDYGVSDWSNIDSTKTQPNRVLWDNFESYQVGTPPDSECWSRRRAGTSFVAVTDHDAYQSSQSVLFYDPPGTEGSYAMLTAKHDTIQNGRFECYLKIDDNGYFAVMGGDARDYVTFSIQFNADNTFDYQNGDSLYSSTGYPVDEWFRLAVEFNIENRGYSIFFNEEIVIENAALMRDDHAGNNQIVFMTFANADLERGYLDDVSVIDNSENNPDYILRIERENLPNGLKRLFNETLDLR